MLSLVLSTIAFVAASYLAKRYMDKTDMPKGMTRNALVFCLALAVAYGVAAVVDWIAA